MYIALFSYIRVWLIRSLFYVYQLQSVENVFLSISNISSVCLGLIMSVFGALLKAHSARQGNDWMAPNWILQGEFLLQNNIRDMSYDLLPLLSSVLATLK